MLQFLGGDTSGEGGLAQGQSPTLFSRLLHSVYDIYCYFSFAHVGLLLDEGEVQTIHTDSAKKIQPNNCNPRELLKEFDSIYNRQAASHLRPLYMSVWNEVAGDERRQFGCGTCVTQTGMEGDALPSGMALDRNGDSVRADDPERILSIGSHCLCRLSAPFILRQFLIWLDAYRDGNATYAEGWYWGALLPLGSFLFMIVHHRMFWLGIFTGFRMRTTLIAALHAKLLRLNTSSIARVTTGHIINLASNDMRRFEYAVGFSPYMFFGPFETVFVLVGVSIVLGFVPAFAGMSCILLIVPAQGVLSKYIAKCRAMTAKVTDKRLNLTGELISGCLAVKMLGWEDPLIADVNAIRSNEHKLLMLRSYIKGANLSLPNITRAIVVCVTFITYRFTNGEFNTPDVFFALSLMMLPRLSLGFFFLNGVEAASEALVTAKRMDAFLKIAEAPCTLNKSNSVDRGTIAVKGGNYAWYGTREDDNNKTAPRNATPRMLSKTRNGEEQPAGSRLRQILTGLRFSVRRRELIGIAGMVGSGKSSLLAALLNDMETMSESERTVRENITFGRPFEEDLYQCVVRSCALDIDFIQFPDGDNTELGERGINISGGQKARVALARAAYSQADIHLLDDPLSAVDPRVGRILFDKCIGSEGIMQNSTRLLVTHQRQYLPLCDRIILMDNGRIDAIGKWKDLTDHHVLSEIESKSNDHQLENTSDTTKKGKKTEDNMDESVTLFGDNTSSNTGASGATKVSGAATRSEKLVDVEGKEEGKVAWRVYWDYTQHVGITSFFIAFALLILSTIFSFLGEWWVARWASANTDDQEKMSWVWTLVGLTASSALTHLISVFALYHLLVIASTRLHEQMLQCVFHAPLKFFHTNPTGRILNRFAKDLGLQDEELPFLALFFLINTMVIIGTFVLVSIALPYMIIFFVVVGWVFFRTCRRYVITSREIKRFDGITRSPVYAMLSANIRGLPTIRAYGNEAIFHEKFVEALDRNGSWWAAFLLTSRWVGFRMDGITFFVMLFSVVVALLLAKQLPLEVLGLALTYTISLSGLLQFVMRQAAELENAMTAVERNMEYTRLEQEPPRVADGGGEAPKGWPSKGNIEYNSVTASYRPGLEPVLKNLSFAIPGGSSVGIVGRTGSGKSSLLLTLFRLIDVGEGTVSIDGVDTASIGIDVLRKQLAVIPQDPVLFGGTLRSNLDPWSERSDARVWDVLQKVCLDAVAKNVGGLDAPIAECGSNLSVGQRQLLCLARALLSNARILALDEATASVDRTTDALIQRSLHSLTTEKDKTLLIIAHRIDTVLDCDLLLVLEQGELVEIGAPNALLSRSEGVFTRMVEAAKKASNPISVCE